MTRHRIIKRHSVLATLIFALSSTAYAAQLGRLEILSIADEPFRAEITVESVTPSQEATLSAGLASVESFAAARLAMDPQLSKLSFEIAPGAAPGTSKVVIRSNQPLNAGFIDALIELNWAGGKVAREYTLTIPVRNVEKPQATQSIPAIKPPVVVPEIRPKLQESAEKAPQADVSARVEKDSSQATPPKAPPVDRRATTEPKLEQKPSAPLNGADVAGPRGVQKGDTLSDIALQMVGEGVTLNQAMAGIFDANREAFRNGSIHQLREGTTLQIPNRSALRRNSPTQALIILALADDRNDFSAYARARGLLDQNGQPTIEIAQPGGSVPSSGVAGGQIGDVREQPAAATAEVDTLKIGPSAGANDALAEEITAKDKALTEANERIALLEQNINDLQRLVEMQGDTTAAPAAGNGSVSGVVAPGTEALGSESHGSEPHGDKSPAEVTPIPKPSIEAPITQVGPEVKPDGNEKQPTEPKDVEPVPDATHAGGALGLMTSPWVLGGMGGLALVVLLLLLWKLRKKDDQGGDEAASHRAAESQSADSFDEALAWASGSSSEKKEVDTGEPTVDAVEDEVFDLDSVLSEEEPESTSQTTEPVLEDALEEEVDPEPELEVEPEEERPEDALPEDPEVEPLSGEVDLDFPEESAEEAEQASDILADLDDIERGAEAAQAELEDIRNNRPTEDEVGVEANFDDIDDIEAADDAESDTEQDEPEEEAPDLDKAMEDLDLDMPNEVDEATWQEVATKLDLASAYVEIGDADGARELLEEIVARGDVDQVRKAKELLASLES